MDAGMFSQGWESWIEALPMGILLTDTLGRFVEANAEATRILGASRDELLGLGLDHPRWRILDPSGGVLPNEQFPASIALRTGMPSRHQILGCATAEGGTLWLDVSVGLAPNKGVIISFLDVSESYRTESVLEARSHIVDVAACATLEEVLRTTLDEAERLTGSLIGFYHFLEADQETLSLQAWSTRTLRDFCQAEGKGRHYAVSEAGVWVDCIRERRPVIHNDYAALAHRKGLPEGHAEITRELVVPVMRGDRLVAILGVGNRPFPYGPHDVELVQKLAELAWDIAETKRAEELLRLRDAALENIHSAVILADFDGKLRYVNATFLKMWKYGRLHEVLGRPRADFWANGGEVRALQQRVLDGETIRGEMMARRSDDSTFQAEFTTTLVRDAQGNPLAVLGTAVDITERQMAQLQLQEQEELFRSAMVHAGVGMAITSLEGRYLKVNPKLCEMLGYSETELLSMSIFDVTYPEDKDADRVNIQKMLAKEVVTGHIEKRYLHKDGHPVFAEVMPSVVWTQNGSPRFFITQAQDISARKQAEDALRASEQMYRDLLERQGEGFGVVDEQERFLFANPVAEEIFGVPKGGLVGRDLFAFLEEDQKAFVLEQTQKRLEGEKGSYDLRIRRPSGEERVIQVTVTSRPPLTNEPFAIIGVFRDITEQRRNEVHLRESQERLSKIYQAANDAIYLLDLETGHYLEVNDAFERITGYSRAEAVGRNSLDLNLWCDPEDRSDYLEEFRQKGFVRNRLIHIRHRSGRELWCECSSDSLEFGGRRCLVNATHDVTDRILADQALRESESKFRGLVESASIPIAIATVDGKIELLNRQFEKLFGYELAELPDLDAWWMRAYPDPVYRRKVQDAWAIAMRPEIQQPRDVSTHDPSQVVCKDGTVCIVDIRLALVGQHVLATFNDLTDRIESERVLRDVLEFNEKLLEAQPLGVLVYHAPSGKCVLANGAITQVIGASVEQVLAQNFREIESWQKYGLLKAAEQVISDDRDVYLETYLESTFGKKSWLSCHLTTFLNHGEKHLLVLCSDISDRKRAEEERHRLEQQVAQAQRLESLGGLAGGVAHDMNNVLGAILGLASVHSQQAAADSKLKHSMETITKACIRGRTLVQGLLGFARQGLAEERILDLNALVRDEVALLERTTLQKVRLIVELAENLKPIKGDPGALSHAIMNLCVNSVDAMPEGGTLTLRTTNEGATSVMLEVCDTGVGMSREVRDRALDPYFTTKPQGRGTGLGLPIVYGTMKAHRGHLELHSELGKGTRVSLHFSACAPEAPPLFPESSAVISSRSLNILVVDDDELVRDSLNRLLELLGHVCVLVDRGEKALRVLEDGTPVDLVILDMNMPEMGGAETLRRIREQHPLLPVILATGRADQQAQDLLEQVPGVTLLPKPFTLDELCKHMPGS